eukprot:g23165.t1
MTKAYRRIVQMRKTMRTKGPSSDEEDDEDEGTSDAEKSAPVPGLQQDNAPGQRESSPRKYAAERRENKTVAEESDGPDDADDRQRREADAPRAGSPVGAGWQDKQRGEATTEERTSHGKL